MKKLGFVGAGRMASAMVEGILATESLPVAEIACTSADDGTGTALASATGITYCAGLEDLLAQCEAIVLAIKPQQLAAIPESAASECSNKLILSILAGTPLSRLQAVFPGARNLVRAMPNTPGQIGAGITAYAPSAPLSEADAQMVEMVLGALGTVLAVPETAMDAVTAVSGSGPAYVFEFVAALRDGGRAAGLDASVADQLARETVLGAAMLLAKSPDDPETQRDRVTSPGGTTEAALKVLGDRKFRDMIGAAVLAAGKRSRELADA